jgi:hypothetical protein
MRFLIILLGLLSAPGLASAQAGRFLLAVGDVVVARGQAEIRAATGTLVQSGDTIRVGPASNAQIRLADESIVGLRPGTVFRVDEFIYSGQADGNERSLFTLLKGGFRTVTGAIGRLHSRERYAVRTPTATIGIRGTHYTVVHCDDDCGTPNRVSLAMLENVAQSDAAPGVGQSIPNGTYGGVTDGRIEVVNQTGEHEFAANTFFYVASANTAPQNLIAPPNFLYDRLEGQSRSRGNKGNESSETLARSGLNAESRSSEVPPPPQPSPFIVTEQKTASGEPTVIAAVPTLGIVGAWTSAIGGAGNGGAFVTDAMLTRAGTGTSQILTAFNIPGSASPAPLGGGTGVIGTAGIVTDAGGNGDGSINANWGVWLTGSITENVGTTSFPGGAHYLFGNLTPAALIEARLGALVGTFPLVMLGGTTPTNNLGERALTPVGSAPSIYPTVTLDFLSQKAALSIFAWQFASNSWTFQGGSAQIFAVPGQGAGITASNLSGTCMGIGCSSGVPTTAPAALKVSGVFFGPSGDHLGVAFGAKSGGAAAQGVQLYGPGSVRVPPGF